MAKVEGPEDHAATTATQASQFYQQALGGYAQEAQRLQMQEQQASQQPWVQLATALSANLAQAKDMPGWVQGLGRTAAQLNPTVDELRARKLAVLGKGAEMGEKGMALDIAQQRTQLEQKQLEEQARQREIATARRTQEDLDNDIKTFVTPFVTAAEARTAPPPFEKFAEMMKTRIPNVEPKQIVSEYEKVEAIAAGREKTFLNDQKVLREGRVQQATEIATAMKPLVLAQKQAESDIMENRQKRVMEARGEIQKGVRNESMKQRLDMLASKMDMDNLKELAKMDPDSKKRILAMESMDKFVTTMRGIVGSKGEFKNYTGGLEGLITDKAPTWMSAADRQILQHMLTVEKFRVIQYGNAGVRGWAPGEDAIRRLGLIGQNSPAAADRIMDEIQRQIALERDVIASKYQFAPWHKTPELLGGANSPLYKKWAPISAGYYDQLREAAGTYTGGAQKVWTAEEVAKLMEAQGAGKPK